MRFVDEAKITVKGGNGGSGCASFLRSRSLPKGGPDGGNGGKGGDVIFVGNAQVTTLLDFRYRRILAAKNGGHGSSRQKVGKDADNLLLEVPKGTEIIDEDSGIMLAEIMQDGESFVVCQGGGGGKGNRAFTSSTNRAPREREEGQEGEERQIELRLKLIADLGLVGLPNVGKSTLLGAITRAKPKIADYAFTTVKPNLGVIDDGYGYYVTVSDLPGIIDGASQGKGLGMRFLGHAERCKCLLFCIDSSIPDIASNVNVLLKEISTYGNNIDKKPAFIAITKSDLLDQSKHDDLIAYCGKLFKKHGVTINNIRCVSALSGEGIEGLLNSIIEWSKLEADQEDKEEWHPLSGY